MTKAAAVASAAIATSHVKITQTGDSYGSYGAIRATNPPKLMCSGPLPLQCDAPSGNYVFSFDAAGQPGQTLKTMISGANPAVAVPDQTFKPDPSGQSVIQDQVQFSV